MLELKFGNSLDGVLLFLFGCWMRRLGDAATGSLLPSGAILVLVLRRKVETYLFCRASEWRPIVE